MRWQARMRAWWLARHVADFVAAFRKPLGRKWHVSQTLALHPSAGFQGKAVANFIAREHGVTATNKVRRA